MKLVPLSAVRQHDVPVVKAILSKVLKRDCTHALHYNDLGASGKRRRIKVCMIDMTARQLAAFDRKCREAFGDRFIETGVANYGQPFVRLVNMEVWVAA